MLSILYLYIILLNPCQTKFLSQRPCDLNASCETQHSNKSNREENRFERSNVTNSCLRKVWERIRKHTALLEQEPLLPSAAVAISDLFHCVKKRWKKIHITKIQMCGESLNPSKYVNIAGAMPSFSQPSRRLSAEHPHRNHFCPIYGREALQFYWAEDNLHLSRNSINVIDHLKMRKPQI